MSPMPLTGQELSALVGRRVKALREAHGLTQSDLAHNSGVSPSRIGALEQGRVGNVCAEVIARLAAALGVSHLDLQREPPGRRRNRT